MLVSQEGDDAILQAQTHARVSRPVDRLELDAWRRLRCLTEPFEHALEVLGEIAFVLPDEIGDDVAD